jgi:hypothetical protein
VLISTLRRLLGRLCDWWAVEDPGERIDGSDDVYLDPAYNGRYTAERQLQELANAEGEDDPVPEAEGDVDAGR